MFELKIKTLPHCPQTPQWTAHDNAGLDLATADDLTIHPSQIQKIRTGITTEFPEGFVALLRDRSGWGTKGLHILAGVIDPNYRGEWYITAINLSQQTMNIPKGTRIAQAIITSYYQPLIVQTQPLTQTQRQDKGYGSTG